MAVKKTKSASTAPKKYGYYREYFVFFAFLLTALSSIFSVSFGIFGAELRQVSVYLFVIGFPIALFGAWYCYAKTTGQTTEGTDRFVVILTAVVGAAIIILFLFVLIKLGILPFVKFNQNSINSS